MESGEIIACDRCVQQESGSAVVFCCNCCLFLCTLCHSDHNRCRETISHELVDVEEQKSTKKSLNVAKYSNQPVVCTKHTTKMKFFCDDCQYLVCKHCIVNGHRGHKLDSLEAFFKSEKESLHTMVQKVDKVFDSLEVAIASGEKMKQQVNQCKIKVDELIMNTFKKIFSTLHNRQQLLHDQNKEIAAAKVVALELQLEEFGVIKEKVALAKQVGSIDYTAAELLSIKAVIQQQLKDKLAILSHLDTDPAEIDSITCSVDTVPVVEQISKLGWVSGFVDPAQCTVVEGLAIPLATVGTERKIKVALRDSEGHILDGSISVSGKLENKANKSVLIFNGTSDNGHASLSFVPEVVGEYELSIKVKNRPIASSPYKFWVHTDRYWHELSCIEALEVSKGCQNVVVDCNGHIYAANYSCDYIEVFDNEGSKVRTIGSSGSGDSQFSLPCGLTIIGDVLYVVDNGNHRVQKFTLAGEYLGQFGSQGSGEGQLNFPYGICSDGNGHVLVADYKNKRVQVFTADGTFSHFISCSSQPKDVAVDNSGNIHVALYNENMLQVFSSCGQEVGFSNGCDSIHKPTGIAIDDKGYKCISCYDSNELVVINPHGGLEVSYTVNQPYGVAIDTQGCVYVTVFDSDVVYMLLKLNYIATTVTI